MLKRKWRENRKNMVKGMLTTVLVCMLLLSNLTCGDNLELNNENHNYPIYSLATLTLNNETQGDIQAQIKIYNRTSGKWQLNEALLYHIKQNLVELTENIRGLKQAEIYDYNDTLLPGEVYIVLSAESLMEIDTIANETVNYVLSHKIVWWYVDSFTIEHLDLSDFNFDIYKYHFDDFIAVINFGTSDSYTIINNTFIPHYPQRNNLTACIILYNGTDWVPNYPFLEYFNNTIKVLNSFTIFQVNDVKIEPFNLDLVENAIGVLHDFNLTPTLPTNVSQTELNHLFYAPSTGYIQLTYSSSLDKNEKTMLYFTIFSLLKHLWFIKTVKPISWVPAGSSYQSSSISVFTVGLSLILVAVSLLRSRKKLYVNSL